MTKLFTQMNAEEQKAHTAQLVSALSAQAQTLRSMGQSGCAKEAERIAKRVQRRYNKTVAPKPKAKKKKEVKNEETTEA